jgi:hypothetical protein
LEVGKRRSTELEVSGSWDPRRLEGEIAVKVDLRFLHLATATYAGLFIGPAGTGVAKDALAIELLFQAAKGFVNRFSAFESYFNHEEETLREKDRAGKQGFHGELEDFRKVALESVGIDWKKKGERTD